jgi:hypothetical protein
MASHRDRIRSSSSDIHDMHISSFSIRIRGEIIRRLTNSLFEVHESSEVSELNVFPVLVLDQILKRREVLEVSCHTELNPHREVTTVANWRWANRSECVLDH